MKAKKLLDKIGVEFVTVKSGQYKDTGIIARESTEKEKELLNKIIKDILNKFVDDVFETRYEKIAPAGGIKIKDEKVKKKKKKKVKEYILTNIADQKQKAFSVSELCGSMQDSN